VIPGERIDIRIPVDDVPVEGTVQNLEGQPVAGATIRVIGLYRPKGRDLEAWQEDVKAGRLNQQLIYDHLVAFEGDHLIDGVLNPLHPPVTTGKGGTFKLTGLGRERVALVRIEGDGIETTDAMLMTRAADAVLPTPVEFNPGLPASTQGRYPVFGARAKVAVAPSRPIVGVVRDADTGKPVPGAVVFLASAGDPSNRVPERMRARADTEGRYRLTGAPVRANCTLGIDGPADQPYLPARASVRGGPGLDPLTQDLALKRGVWATVRVFDRSDKSAVAGEVDYFVMADNPNAKNLPTLRPTRVRKARVEDETVRVAVLPGPGVVAVRVPWQHPFVALTSPRAAPLDTLPYPFRAQNYLGHVKIDPGADAKEVKCEIGLTRGIDP
jgi:hypothetical protein